jgi:hypothetical protein
MGWGSQIYVLRQIAGTFTQEGGDKVAVSSACSELGRALKYCSGNPSRNLQELKIRDIFTYQTLYGLGLLTTLHKEWMESYQMGPFHSEHLGNWNYVYITT